MLIVSWNVNSIVVRLPDVLQFIKMYNPDVLLLQEIKCEKGRFPIQELESVGYNVYIHGQKAYNGVAILSRHKVHEITTSFDDPTAQVEARYIQGYIKLQSSSKLYISSVYVPNGRSVRHDKYKEKLLFLSNLASHISQLAQSNMVIGGDFNASPFDIDVYSADAMSGILSFTLDEKKALRSLMNAGFDDCFRTLHPYDKKFSWWDYRGGSVAHNQGLRIDMLFATAAIINHLQAAKMYKFFRKTEKPSDHIPCSIQLNLQKAEFI